MKRTQIVHSPIISVLLLAYYQLSFAFSLR